MTDIIKKDKYVIPTEDRSVIIEPPLSLSGKLIETNRNRIQQYSITICGYNFDKLRAQIRREVVSKAVNYTRDLLNCWNGSLKNSQHIDHILYDLENTTIVLTGHAPGFYSTGVWIKNHLVDKLAKSNKGIGINIIVDNDTPNGISFPVPSLKQESPSIKDLKICELNKGLPFEESNLPSILEAQKDFETDALPYIYHNIKEDCASILREVASNGTVNNFIDLIIHSSRCTNNLGEQLTFARRQFEESFAIDNLETPISRICETEGFLVFFLSIALEHEQFARVYNSRLEDYRKASKIRSKVNPLPNLARDNGLTELPFWVWRKNGSRKRVYIQKDGDGHLEILAEDSITETSLKSCKNSSEELISLGKLHLGDYKQNVERLKAMTMDGFKIRPKALTNTLFLRLFLADVFIHGVGGAKYDMITDGIIEDFFRVTPPRYIAISATLYPPFEKFGVNDKNLLQLENEVKQIRHNPDKYIPDDLLNDLDIRGLVLEKQGLIKGGKDENKKDTREKFLRIKEINALLNSRIGKVFAEKESEIVNLREKLKYNSIINNRSYPFFIYPREFVRKFYDTVLSA